MKLLKMVGVRKSIAPKMKVFPKHQSLMPPVFPKRRKQKRMTLKNMIKGG